MHIICEISCPFSRSDKKVSLNHKKSWLLLQKNLFIEKIINMKNKESLEIRLFGMVIKSSGLTWKGVAVIVCVLLFFLLL